MQAILTRKGFGLRVGSLLARFGVASAAYAWLEGAQPVRAASDEISHTGEAIHQEIIFAATPERVYQALTDEERFDKVVALSAAMHSMALGTAPTRIGPGAGGAFSLFGGYVTGRTVELAPNARLVQAWRSGSWKPGAYSIATFELAAEGAGTKLRFEHAGFPGGEAQTLAKGWHENYWQPLAKYLA